MPESTYLTNPSTTNVNLGNPAGISAFADRMADASSGYVVSLAAAVGNLTPPAIVPEFPTAGEAPAMSVPPAPETTPVIWTAPAMPAAFSGSIEAVLPAAFDGSGPDLAWGTAPTLDAGAVPSAPGVTTSFDDPTLSITLPAPPNLLTLSIATFDGVTIPGFAGGDVPELTAVAPSVVSYTPGTGYTSTLLTALKTELQDRIENGGTGINPDVEDAIWDRGREKEARANADAILELERMETLGYAFPSGVYLDARIKINTETAYVAAGISREIMIKQAELEQTNVLAALKSATELEGMLIQSNNQVEQRLFESCKYATEAGVAIYNAKVQAYASLCDAYKTKVEIYKAQLQGELAKVEVYKAQISAEQAKAQVNVALVQQYKVQADVALSNVEIYKAQIQGIATKAEIEKIKVMIFGEQIKAYTAQVNAYTAGVEGFKASIQAEGLKVEAYKGTVQAYAAQVSAAATAANVRIEEFKGKVAAKSMEWDGYKAMAQAEESKAKAIAANNSGIAEIYTAEVRGLTGYNEVLTKQWQVALDQAQRVSEIGVAAAKANGEFYMTTRSLALDAAKVGAQVSAQLGAAAINCINWSTSYSTSNSTAFSNSNSYSVSISQSDNTNYNYSL